MIAILSDQEILYLLHHFLGTGLVVSPWLVGMHGNARFDIAIYELIDRNARDISAKFWTEGEKIKIFGSIPIPERLARTAVYEVAASTAVSISYEISGNIEVDESIVNMALDRLSTFTDKHGFGSLVAIYTYVTIYENLNAVDFYGKILEKDFILGSWHRPWVDYSLSDELLLGSYIGNYRIRIMNQLRYVELTPLGAEKLKNTEQLLFNSGYLSTRVKQLQIANFNTFENYSQNSKLIWPTVHLLRMSFLNWSHISPGMKVLELGCGDGAFTFAGGLAERIGKNGLLVGVDPSPVMVAKATEKLLHIDGDWIHFIQGQAENLPFLDQSFDAVIGVGVLHFLQLPAALNEIYRVLKPGGFFASMHPTSFSPVSAPFFQEWFEPLLKMAKKKSRVTLLDYLSSPESNSAAFSNSGFVNISSDLRTLDNHFPNAELTINHYILGVGWFLEELSMIPWKARIELIQELIDRGQRICEKYSDSERIIEAPMQFLKGFRPI